MQKDEKENIKNSDLQAKLSLNSYPYLFWTARISSIGIESNTPANALNIIVCMRERIVTPDQLSQGKNKMRGNEVEFDINYFLC